MSAPESLSGALIARLRIAPRALGDAITITRWVIERPGLRPRTIKRYLLLLRKHIAPKLGYTSLADLSQPVVRSWRAQLLADGVGEVTVAKAYRLLKAILTTAVDDELIKRNPCRIPGAGVEPSPERPTATLAQVFAVADKIDPRFRSLVLLTTFTGLRYGEVMALRRNHIDLRGKKLRVVASVSEVSGSLVTGPPKSAAGHKTIAIPELLIPDLRIHLDKFAS